VAQFSAGRSTGNGNQSSRDFYEFKGTDMLILKTPNLGGRTVIREFRRVK
jgi:hypothetical protein